MLTAKLPVLAPNINSPSRMWQKRERNIIVDIGLNIEGLLYIQDPKTLTLNCEHILLENIFLNQTFTGRQISSRYMQGTKKLLKTFNKHPETPICCLFDI